MAERERFRVDGRAVRIGVGRALALALAVFVALNAVAYVVRPVVRSLLGADRTPGPVAIGLLAAALGGAFGLASVRGARRVRVEGFTGTARPGARALELARLAAARGDQGGRGRSSDVGVVQRWTPDLLRGGDVHALEAGLDREP